MEEGRASRAILKSAQGSGLGNAKADSATGGLKGTLFPVSNLSFFLYLSVNFPPLAMVLNLGALRGEPESFNVGIIEPCLGLLRLDMKPLGWTPGL